MDWSEFEKEMVRRFPFLPKHFMSGEFAQQASAWAQDYVKQNIDRLLSHSAPQDVFPSVVPGVMPGMCHYNLIETNRSVILRLHLPKNVSPHAVKTSVNQRKVRIELPSGKIQQIRLDKPVHPRRSRANYKRGVLEIRMPKIKEPSHFHDIYLND